MKPPFRFVALALAAAFALPFSAAADDDKPEKPDEREAPILKNAEAFIAAFEKGDAAAVAAFWTTDGDLIDISGREFKGRDAIQKEFSELLPKLKGSKLRITVNSVRFVGDNTAIEDGTSTLIEADGTKGDAVRYSNVHVLQDGKWLLASVRESAITDGGSHAKLQDLSWILGEWVDDTASGELARVVFSWAPGKHFLIARHAVEQKNGRIVGEGEQWIGWDAEDSTIRSWSFEYDGGFSEGTWTQNGKQWLAKTESHLPDGRTIAATNVITPTGPSTITFQSIECSVDGEKLADTAMVKMKRVK